MSQTELTNSPKRATTLPVFLSSWSNKPTVLPMSHDLNSPSATPFTLLSGKLSFLGNSSTFNSYYSVLKESPFTHTGKRE